jgi:membrane fusion protein (multidrug efflux system)
LSMKALFSVIIIVLVGLGVWFIQGDVNTVSDADNPGSNRGSGRPNMPGGFMPQTVMVEPVQYREISDIIESIGTTFANESVTITSKVTDTVNRVHFQDGDYVDAGKILVEMTNREESALLAEAQANLDEARRQLSRQQDLGKQGLVAKSAIDEALTRAEAAEARFNAITARMNDRLIQAPFSGLLGFRQISSGTMLNSNTPITTLDDISVIKLDFSVPEVYLGTIQPGVRIISRSDAWRNREFEGVINSIGSRVDPVTRAVTIRAIIDNDERLLRPGMLMTVKIINEVRESLVVPESALLQVGSDTYVYIAGDDGLAHRTLISVGVRRVGYVEVVDGLKVGDLIVTEGGFKLQNRAPYRIATDKQGNNLHLTEKSQSPAGTG